MEFIKVLTIQQQQFMEQHLQAAAKDQAKVIKESANQEH